MDFRQLRSGDNQKDMSDITLVTINWNNQPAMELMLKSYVRHHYRGESLNLLLVDNGSTDNCKEWLRENNIPFVDFPKNIFHEPAMSLIYQDIKTKYALLCDTDVEFFDDVSVYLQAMKGKCISVGELQDKDSPIWSDQMQPRISSWFWLFNIQIMKENGINVWRVSDNRDWSYDTGAWYWEQMVNLGFTNFNLTRKPGNINTGLGMEYEKFTHFGKCSWDLTHCDDRTDEVKFRMAHIRQRLLSYEDINLKDKFIREPKQ
jgi:glycosyltransferase involved in cell wall biosynthesis